MGAIVRSVVATSEKVQGGREAPEAEANDDDGPPESGAGSAGADSRIKSNFLFRERNVRNSGSLSVIGGVAGGRVMNPQSRFCLLTI